MKVLRIYNLGCEPRTIDFWLLVLKCRTVTHENVLRTFNSDLVYSSNSRMLGSWIRDKRWHKVSWI